MSVGRWVPVNVDNSAAVLAQVNEFVEGFRVLSGSVPAIDMKEVTEKRIQKMLESVELRMEVITDFIDANPGARVGKLTAAARALRTLLAHEGIGPSGLVHLNHVGGTLSSQSAALESSGLSVQHPIKQPQSALAHTRGGQLSVSFVQDNAPRHPGPATNSPRKNSSVGSPGQPLAQSIVNASSVFNVSFSENAEHAPSSGQNDNSVVDMTRAAEDSRIELYVQQLKTREEALKYKLQFSTEREHEVLQKLRLMEQENLRLERALVEISESRERMKGLVEEQVYTQALHTRLMGLLHLEKNRTKNLTIGRGVMFWCISFLFILHLLLTVGEFYIHQYNVLRDTVTRVFPYWTAFILDCCLTALTLSLSHEWSCFAVHDICHGAIYWVIATVANIHDDQPTVINDVSSARFSRQDTGTTM